MAPRHQIATAFGLTGLGIGWSLMTHVIVQHLAANRVGLVNYIHFSAESAGLLGGAACIFRLDSALRARHLGSVKP